MTEVAGDGFARHYLANIIALCSPAMGSGKSEAARHLTEAHGFTLVKFAGPLKDMARALLAHRGTEDIEAYVEGHLKEVPIGHFATWLRNNRASSVLTMARALAPHLGVASEDFDVRLLSERDEPFPGFPELTMNHLLDTLLRQWIDAVAPRHDTPVTPRRIMQTLGTEWGRDCIAVNFWTRIAAERCRTAKCAVIDDMRFANELDTVARLGGTPVRIIRPEAVVTGGGHASEGELDGVPMREIRNDGTLEDLAQKIDDLVAESL